MLTEKQKKVSYLRPVPRVLAPAEHGISPDRISRGAVKVLRRLQEAGFGAYLVGGSVRDMLLGREPKDFDVATDARPGQVRELFRNSHLIGRRFRLAHVRFGDEIIEVSTFRAPHEVAEEAGQELEGRILRDNVYGTIEEDVWRRDFTVNALFYNLHDGTVIDYVGGVRDINDGLIRLIGDPEKRYVEDPVRLLRAVRFSVKLGFRLEEETERPIRELGPLLDDIPSGRRFEEALKLFMGGVALQTFEQLRHFDLFRSLFPQTDAVLAQENGGFPHTFVIHALKNTDSRIADGKTVTPGFLIAAFLWMPVSVLAEEHVAQGTSATEAVDLAGDIVISRQVASTAFPRRFTQMAREIWQLQSRLERRSGRRPQRMLQHPRFRAAYDFLLLRQQSGDDVGDAVDYWTECQRQHPPPQDNPAPKAQRSPHKRRRRRGRRRSRD